MQAIDQAPNSAMNSALNHSGFEEMIGIYSASGGTTTADDLALLLEQRNKGNFVSLVRHIALRDIVSYEWRNHYWIPLFQFDIRNMDIKQEVRRVTQELSPVFDNGMLAMWFAEPNTWLKGRRPVDWIDSHFSDVLCAAQAHRLVAVGLTAFKALPGAPAWRNKKLKQNPASDGARHVMQAGQSHI